ncbi:MAG: class I SAM-dependent methyltransferase [Candidatus Nezhaarchaeales archaeon]
MRPEKARLRYLYDITSKFYDELYGYEQIKKFTSVFNLGILKESKFKVVLDAGCGTGLVTEKLRSKGALVVGVDFSKGMIQKAKEKLNETVEVDFVICDVEYLPFRPKAFDLVVSLTVIQNCNPLRAFRSLLRVLSNNGVLVLSYPKRSKEVRMLEAKLQSYILRELDPVDNIVILGRQQTLNLITRRNGGSK